MQIRCDNGPEYISATLAAWAKRHDITLVFIQPGNPQQNAYIERYNRTVRYDWLAQYLFHSIEEVQEYATQWLWTYNNERPNMALGGITPQQNWPGGLNSTFDTLLMGGYPGSKAPINLSFSGRCTVFGPTLRL